MDLSDNPHGIDGVRCLVRLLASKTCNINVFRMDAFHDKTGDSGDGNILRFGYSDPTGRSGRSNVLAARALLAVLV